MTDKIVTGDLSVNGGTFLSGPVFLNRFSRMGDATVAGAFTVLLVAAASGAVTARGDSVLQGALNADTAFHGPTTVTGALLVEDRGTEGAAGTTCTSLAAGTLEALGALTIDGLLTTSDKLSVTSNATLSDLDVGGTLTAGDNGLTLTGIATVGDQVAASGALEVRGTLTVGDDFTVGGEIVTMGTLAVLGTVLTGEGAWGTELTADVVAAAGGVVTNTARCETLCVGGPLRAYPNTSMPRFTYSIQLESGSGAVQNITFAPGSTDTMGAVVINCTGIIISPAQIAQNYSSITIRFSRAWPSAPRMYIELGPEYENYVTWEPWTAGGRTSTTQATMRLAALAKMSFPPATNTVSIRYLFVSASS